jgi:CHAT domain-containing protein
MRVEMDEIRSEAVTFRMAVQAAPDDGEDAAISAVFSHNGRPGGRVSLSVAVSDREGARPSATPGGAIEPAVEVDARALAPDLTVEIASVENDGRRFEVHVSTPLLTLERSTETWWLPAESGTLVAHAMRRFFEPQASRAARLASLRGAGMEFYDAAPALFKEIYWRLHDAGRPPRNLYLVSDERHIPWELMIPQRRTPDGGVEVRDPLGVELAIGRWHRRTAVSPRQNVPLRSSYVVAPVYAGGDVLPSADAEAELVCRRFAGQRIAPARFEQLDRVLAEKGADLLHFVCHGEADRGGTQVMLLEDAEALDPQRLRAMAGLATACRRHKPLVFLNACEVGRPAAGLVGPSGFARSFIEVDASGVIGTLWSVDDRTAHDVAVRFYDAVYRDDGTPFAEHLRRIRAEGFAQDGEDTYAAYCFYGDPAARPTEIPAAR